MNQFMICSTQLYRVISGEVIITPQNRLTKYVLNNYCKEIMILTKESDSRYNIFLKNYRSDVLDRSEQLLELLYYSLNSGMLKTKDFWMKAFPNTMSKKSFAMYG